MAEFNPPKSEKEFEDNFSQLKPLMNDTQAYAESSRCLFCYDAPCIAACPTGIDIPMFIRQINTKNAIGAAQTIYESNYFGHSCGKVCPTEVLCEGACVFNHQDVKPIEIGRLQSFATTKAIAQNTKLVTIPKPTGKKVAIVGAGPAGISCACELRSNGHEVVIFEAKSKPSGLTVHGVAPYKIENKDVMDEMDYLQKQFGFIVRYNSPISTRQDILKLEKEFDAIFLGIGLGKTSELGIPGENLQHVFGAVEFIETLREKHHLITVPKRVVVLGGGNTAMDAASECARMGATDVTLAYRRGKEEMGAYEFEYDLAKGVGVKGVFHASPVAIVGNGKVEGVTFIKTEEKNGSIQTIKGSEFTIPCDWVIKATGQVKQTEFLKLIDGLKFDSKGRIQVDENHRTTHTKYFASGDAVSGGQEVVNAAAGGKLAAQKIMEIVFK